MALLKYLGVFAVALSLATADTQTCCDQLAGLTAPAVFQKSNAVASTQYKVLATQRWSNTAILTPSCIITPTSVEEVSRAIKIVAANQCKFAVKSGGHMAIPGYNSINDGVSIDLAKLNQTSLAADRSFVSLGAGSTWGAAYDTFSPQGVGFPGGLCGTTGVGGVSLGGGESYFMGKVGWVVDNVLNYQIVLANGTVADANQTSNADLYRALKGGSSNFGVVTRVDVAAFEYSDLWAGVVSVPANANNTETTLLGLTNFTRLNSVDSALQVLFQYTAAGARAIDMGMANVAANEPAESLSEFYTMTPQYQNTLGTHTVSTAVHEINTVQPSGYRDAGATVTFVNDEATILAIHNVTNAIYEGMLAKVPDADLFFSYIPQPKIVETHAEKRGGNMLGLAGTTTDQVVMFLNPRWSDEADDATMYAASQAWVDEVRKVTDAHGTSHPFLYLNFAAEFQKPFCGYGDDNVRFLRTTAARYDPDGVFQTLLPGGFKVFTEC